MGGGCIGATLLLGVPLSRLKPTHAEEAAGTVGALAVTAALAATAAALADGAVRALPRAAEVSGALAPSAWRVSAGRASVLAPSAWRASAARELAIAPSAWRASAGRISEAAGSQAAVSPGVRWRPRAWRPPGWRAAAAPFPPPRPAPFRGHGCAPPPLAAAARC